jgi:anti-sigma B factor antagonist
MIVEKRRVAGNTVLHVEGVIKLGESARFFADTLKKVLAEDGGNVLIDLARINYIDSTGIGELVGYLGRFQEVKRKLILVEPSEPIRKLLRVAHLDQLFPIYGSLDDAVAGEGRAETGAATT